MSTIIATTQSAFVAGLFHHLRIFLALIVALAITACTAPVTEGPRSLNNVLLDAHGRNEVMLRQERHL